MMGIHYFEHAKLPNCKKVCTAQLSHININFQGLATETGNPIYNTTHAVLIPSQ